MPCERIDDECERTEKPCESDATQYPIPNNTLPSIKTLDQSAIDHLFEKFWLAGIRKVNKKKAKSLFNNLLKKKKDPQAFTDALIYDVKKRLDKNQLGFAEMHPTTYLNGERWNDEVINNENQPGQNSTGNRPQKLSVVERVARANEERERARQESSGAGDGYAMDSPNGDIRPPIAQPIRGDNAGQLGAVIDGDYTRADS